MFDRLIQILEDNSGDRASPLNPLETAAAVAALYFHMISADGVVTSEEISRFRSMLREQFDLNDAQLDQVAARGVQEDRESPGLFPFTSIVNTEMDVKQREEVLEHLRELALADGEMHEAERDFLAHVERLLRLD